MIETPGLVQYATCASGKDYGMVMVMVLVPNVVNGTLWYALLRNDRVECGMFTIPQGSARRWVRRNLSVSTAIAKVLRPEAYHMQGYRKYIVGKISRLLIQQPDNFISDISVILISRIITRDNIMLQLSDKKRDK